MASPQAPAARANSSQPLWRPTSTQSMPHCTPAIVPVSLLYLYTTATAEMGRRTQHGNDVGDRAPPAYGEPRAPPQR